jgi:predicted PilT family ATPase
VKKRELGIIIIGDSGSGKSTIALMLEEFLKEKGLNVNMDVDNEIFDYGSEQKFRELYKKGGKKRIKAIAEKTEITIRQEQLNRRPKQDENN